MKNNTTAFLSPRETEAIARLSYEKAVVVTLEQMKGWLKYPSGIFERTVARLKRKGILKDIKKGVYFYSPLENGSAGTTLNEYLVPPILFPGGGYYIGYTTMFNYYGFLDQIPQTMYVLNTSIQRKKVIGRTSFKFLKIASNRIYGVKKLSIRNSQVLVSDRERTLVDLIYFPDPVGGLKTAFLILQKEIRRGKIDIERLIRYTVRFPGKTTRKRIGYILERSGVKKSDLKPLMNSVKRSSLTTLYDSKSRKGSIDNNWKVIINVA